MDGDDSRRRGGERDLHIRARETGAYRWASREAARQGGTRGASPEMRDLLAQEAAHVAAEHDHAEAHEHENGATLEQAQRLRTALDVFTAARDLHDEDPQVVRGAARRLLDLDARAEVPHS
ncbi:hypothetical protein CLV92_10975 [Kineococcus xinjiangensis]|uniref:Uncharacterized protein n=1 Tax=Kineococcus xinjiangensis TaxID=512762 RepID=A0A2S6IHV2_9ACTN|nr:hypothetical protein [Kineococcus xinjiangensis]PPK93799.1 hypothetical protein CLV92_10975 [Kineococcus xinjiangensis]